MSLRTTEGSASDSSFPREPLTSRYQHRGPWGNFEGGGGLIGPSLVTKAPPRTRLKIVHQSEGATAELGLKTKSMTRGDLGGIEFTGSDDAEVLEVRFRLAPPDDGVAGDSTFNMTLRRPI